LPLSLVIILGPTAVGKTALAANLAFSINGEVISADSRQVYRKMDIGTGKDLNEFQIEGQTIPYHLIDTRDIGQEYNVFQFQKDFYKAYEAIRRRNNIPILCGGTGLYLEAALSKQQLLEVPEDKLLRQELATKSLIELQNFLKSLVDDLHNSTDLTDKERILRAIEIASYKKENQHLIKVSPIEKSIVFGIKMERAALRERIKVRLEDRLSNGMVEEVSKLLDSGITLSQLKWFGLEYKFIAAYLAKEISYNEMFEQLLQSIRRFSKKQMTWYRRMEKNGTKIHWMDADWTMEKKLNFIQERIDSE
tara:strand:+ start:922 stop:1842 length:921 start_codon:yes stop_codon:yes gene_type:complete